MTRYLKSALLVAAGLCWFAVAVGFVFLFFEYMAEGAGLQVFGFFGISSLTIAVGLVHIVGFSAGAFLSFLIGAGLCAHGLVPAPGPQGQVATRPKQVLAELRQLMTRRHSREPDFALRCVCCRTPFAAAVHICPECGWTQPYGGRRR